MESGLAPEQSPGTDATAADKGSVKLGRDTAAIRDQGTLLGAGGPSLELPVALVGVVCLQREGSYPWQGTSVWPRAGPVEGSLPVAENEVP